MVNPPAENILSGNNDETGFIDTGDFGYFPPLGMLYVVSYLEEHTEGHEIFFKDCIAEQITHEELRALGGLYSQLSELQEKGLTTI